ncbi:MAG TPA: hypothetical protein VLZ30_06905, partial [Verrucomicrobiae bacterium]|nr:hypothetical protein [Verrucomicrobiae bacterium]
MLISFFFGFLSRHPGIVLVLVSVTGEIVLEWKDVQGKKALAKRICWAGLILGLALDFEDAAKSDKEVASLNKQASEAWSFAGQAQKYATEARLLAAQTESNNLTLKTELEKIKAPRHITPEQRKSFIESLKNVQPGPVDVAMRHPDGETLGYARQVVSLLMEAHFTIVNYMNYPGDALPMNDHCDIGIVV